MTEDTIKIPTDAEIETLLKAVNEAQTARDTAQADAVKAGKSGDFAAMQTAMTNHASANKAFETADRAHKAAVTLKANASRIAASVAAKEYLKTVTLVAPEIAEAIAQGCTGFHISFDAEKNPVFSVTTGIEATRTRAPRSDSGEPRKGRNQYQLADGTVVSGRAMLEAHADKDYVAKALDTDANWESKGLKFRPGIDAAVKKLAAEIGATLVPAA